MYRKNAWNKYRNNLEEVMNFSEGYKDFLSFSKTERLAVRYAKRLLDENGFKDASEVKSVKAGDKLYFINKNKNVCAFLIGSKPLTDGLRILGAHIDSPRIDFKENPLYESNGFALADTHYYGGIKKYQWTARPLALRGVVIKKDGTSVEINIGDKENDPVLGIGDLLIHLSQDQLAKTGAKVVEGEDLDITLGNIRFDKEEDKKTAKQNVLDILKKEYDLEEEDLVSAEIEVVPQGEAKDYGLDRSMVAGYGHDDRVCAYTSLKALLDTKKVENTACVILVDKEEIGSVGATGAQSLFFENTIARLAELMGLDHPLYTARKVMEASKMLSSDVSAGFDPLYPSVNDSKNAAYLGLGLVFNKYTGARGKSGSNDSNPEYYAWIRKIMDESDVNWQNAELGKVDQGGGGTIAYILGNYNMNVIDAGIPVLNMHAPMEVVSKVDVLEAYKGYIAFLTK